APPVIVFSSACAGLAGGAVPALAQLASSSYHAAVTSPSLSAPPPQKDNISKSRTSSTI
nr:ankyrin repeat and KH domain-containing protein [Tanacetum cinerariifolium]